MKSQQFAGEGFRDGESDAQRKHRRRDRQSRRCSLVLGGAVLALILLGIAFGMTAASRRQRIEELEDELHQVQSFADANGRALASALKKAEARAEAAVHEKHVAEGVLRQYREQKETEHARWLRNLEYSERIMGLKQ